MVVNKFQMCVWFFSLEKYKTIYTSVPTPDNNMAYIITDEISNLISNTDLILMSHPI